MKRIWKSKPQSSGNLLIRNIKTREGHAWVSNAMLKYGMSENQQPCVGAMVAYVSAATVEVSVKVAVGRMAKFRYLRTASPDVFLEACVEVCLKATWIPNWKPICITICKPA